MAVLTIDQRLVLLRKQKGVNQDTVAEACNISRVSLARYENGTRTPIIEIASRLADYYGVSVDYILGRDEAAQPADEAQRDQPKHGPETQAIIDQILAKLSQLDASDRRTIESNIDFLIAQKKGEEK